MAIDNIESKDNNTGLSEGKKEISEVRDTTANKAVDIINSKENPYEGMRKVQIEVNGESKELYIDNENFKIDSSDWESKKIYGVLKFGTFNAKINPEGDIIEIPYGESVEQLFTIDAIKRESKKIGKRLPFANKKNPELQSIIKKIGPNEFSKIFPGNYIKDLWKNDLGTDINLWADSCNGKNIYAGGYNKKNPIVKFGIFNDKSYFLSVRLVKDID